MAEANSTVYAAQLKGWGNASNVYGRMKHVYVDYVHTEAAGVYTLNLVRIPERNIMVHPQLGLFGCSQMVSTADVHLGYVYTTPAGVLTADDNFWMDNVDAGGGAITTDLFGDITGVVAAGLVPASNVFTTQDGLLITCTVDTANIEVGDTITLFLPYSVVG